MKVAGFIDSDGFLWIRTDCGEVFCVTEGHVGMTKSFEAVERKEGPLIPTSVQIEAGADRQATEWTEEDEARVIRKGTVCNAGGRCNLPIDHSGAHNVRKPASRVVERDGEAPYCTGCGRYVNGCTCHRQAKNS